MIRSVLAWPFLVAASFAFAVAWALLRVAQAVGSGDDAANEMMRRLGYRRADKAATVRLRDNLEVLDVSRD